MVLFIGILLLVSALCLDSFVAAFAFGAQKIKIPLASAVLISLICTATLAVSLFIGALAAPYLPGAAAAVIAFLILGTLGVTRLLDGMIKNMIRKSRSGAADIRFRFMSFDFLLRIYADNTQADSDHSKCLSLREAAPLALALSVDGLAAGIGAGLTEINYPLTLLCAFVIDLALVLLGCAVGRRIAAKTDLNLAWVSGAVLIGLALSKLV